MTTVAVISKPYMEELYRLLPELIAWLREHGCEPLLDIQSAQYTQDASALERTKLAERLPGLVIVLGGDGTLLDAARHFAAAGTLIMGVNLGSLGFLTEVRVADLYNTLEKWCEGRHESDERAMLHTEYWSRGKSQASFEALNEIVISKGVIGHMCEFSVEMDGRTVAVFRADGVIISTPTGSTAYSLAAGGPILTPDADALVVTPICPHLLTLRPLVVRGSASLTVRVEEKPNQALLTVDGQQAGTLCCSDEVRCCRSSHTVKLVRMSEGGFFEVLRSKLSWGERKG